MWAKICEFDKISLLWGEVSNQLSLNPKGDYLVMPDLNIWILKRAQPFRQSETQVPAGLESKHPCQSVKNLPAMQETWVWFLGWEDALEKEMATHSSTLAWRTLWTEEAGHLQSMGVARVGHSLRYLSFFHIRNCLQRPHGKELWELWLTSRS